MSDLIKVFPRNPDPVHSGCRVTGNIERGVAFISIEPLEGKFTFVGETALLEAVGLLYDLTPNQTMRALGEGTQAQEKKLARVQDEADEWQERYTRLRADLEGLIGED